MAPLGNINGTERPRSRFTKSVWYLGLGMPKHPQPGPIKFGVITLGCDKNTVDSERYVAQLADRGAEYTSELTDADVIVVNTCGFIDAAKKESIDALIEAGRLKDAGSCRAVVGVGCMVQRHKEELI